MEIIITPGETDLIAQFETGKCTIKNLLVGDAQIHYNGQVVYIFERKSKGDLNASILDGRYREQKGRLLKTGLNPHQIVYILEKLVVTSETEARIRGAICNTIHRDKCSIVWTTSVADTADYIRGMAASIEKFGPPDAIEKEATKLKKTGATVENMYGMTLQLIPGVSAEIASLIQEKYPAMADLWTVYKAEGANAISKMEKASGRKIGPKLSSKIYDYLNALH